MAVIRTAIRIDDYKEYHVVCPECGTVLVSEELIRANQWFLKEQQCFREKKGMFLVVEGGPVPQGRPRFASVKGKFIHAYDPKKSVVYKQLIQWHIRMFLQKYPDFVPLQENIVMDLKIFRKIPASFSKRKQDMANAGLLLPNTKPDTDNYVKTVQDAANGLVFKDDSAIVKLTAMKFYSDTPRIEVAFYSFSPNNK